MEKAVLFIYRMMSRKLVLVDKPSTLGHLESVAAFELRAVFRVDTAQVRYNFGIV
jgi:hypothetical protein